MIRGFGYADLDTAGGRLGGVHPCTSKVPQRSHSNQPFPGLLPFIQRMIRAQYGHGVSGIRASGIAGAVATVAIQQTPAPARAVRMPFTNPSADVGIVRARRLRRSIGAIASAL